MKTMQKKTTFQASDPPVCPRLWLCPIPMPFTCGTRMMWWSPYLRTTAPRWALCCWLPSPTSPPSSPHPTTAPQCPTVLGWHLLSHGTSEKKRKVRRWSLATLYDSLLTVYNGPRPNKTYTDKSCAPEKDFVHVLFMQMWLCKTDFTVLTDIMNLITWQHGLSNIYIHIYTRLTIRIPWGSNL